MGLFGTSDELLGLLTGWLEVPARAESSEQVTIEMFEAGIAPDREHDSALARARWLAEHRAEGSFPCGVVVIGPEALAAPVADDPWARGSEMPASAVAVTAAVLPDVVVFFPQSDEVGGMGPVAELGRIPRASIVEVDVENAGGVHVAEPAHETLEPSEPIQLVLRWTSGGMLDEDRFGFRSSWSAWDAGRRLRRARLPAA